MRRQGATPGEWPTTHGRRVLFVAATGGHLEQALRIKQVLDQHVELVDVATFENEQSRSLPITEPPIFVEHVPSRGWGHAARLLPSAVRILRAGRYTDVVSTGSGVAVPFMGAGRALGLRCHYIESAARTQGPSLTGKLLGYVPGVHRSTQYRDWAGSRWSYAGSVFDGYVYDPLRDPPVAPMSVVVTLGMSRGFPFQSAVDATERLLHDLGVDPDRVLWQVGDVDHPPPGARAWLPAGELARAMHSAELVVAHSGVGSCLAALDAGRVPLLLPRRAAAGEAIDDHQAMVADLLAQRGLAVVCQPEELTTAHARRAMAGRAVRDFTDTHRLLDVLELG